MCSRPFRHLGEINLSFCCVGSHEIYFGLVVRQKVIIILSFQVGISKNKNNDHRGKETCVMFGLSIQNKSIAINTSLTFLFEFVELKEKHYIKRKYPPSPPPTLPPPPQEKRINK